MAAVSCLIFLLCPLASIPFILIGLINERRNLKIFLVLIVGVVAILSYCYSPLDTENNDINRYFNILNLFRESTFEKVTKQPLFYTMPLFLSYLWLIGKTWLSNHIFQFLTAIIGCGCNMAILYRTGLDNSAVTKRAQVLSFFIFAAMFNWLCYLSYVRMPMGLAICAYCLYDEFTNRRNPRALNWGLCLSMIFWHTAIIIIILIALLSRVKILKKLIGVMLAIWGLFYTQIEGILSQYKTNVIINRLCYMLDTYMDFSATKSPRWQFVQMVCIISILAATLGIRYFNAEVFKKYNGFYWLVINTALFTLGSAFQFDLFMRMGWIVFMFSLAVFPVLFSSINGRCCFFIKMSYILISSLAGLYQVIAIYIPYTTFVGFPQMILTNLFTIILGVE